MKFACSTLLNGQLTNFWLYFSFRKRGRNLHEDEVEFMPLSKRINNLHINNGLFFDNSNPMETAAWGPGPPGYTQSLPETPPSSVQSIDWNSVPQYTPDLNESQNPHYFNVNKLLFEMYLQRMHRGGHPLWIPSE